MCEDAAVGNPHGEVTRSSVSGERGTVTLLRRTLTFSDFSFMIKPLVCMKFFSRTSIVDISQ